MSTTLTNVYDIVRLLLQAQDTTEYTAADLLIHVNNAQRWWFDNMEKRVKLVTLETTLAANAFIKALETGTTYPEILNVSLKGTLSDAESIFDEIPLQPLPWSELRRRQHDNSTAAQPTHWAAHKQGGTDPTATNLNRWDFATYPVPDATYAVYAVVRDYPPALTTGTDTLFVGNLEGRALIPIIAAIYASEGAGRPDLSEDLVKLLPRIAQDRLMAHASHEEVMA